MEKYLEGNGIITNYLPKKSLVTISFTSLLLLLGTISSMAADTNKATLLVKKTTATAYVSEPQQQK